MSYGIMLDNKQVTLRSRMFSLYNGWGIVRRIENDKLWFVSDCGDKNGQEIFCLYSFDGTLAKTGKRMLFWDETEVIVIPKPPSEGLYFVIKSTRLNDPEFKVLGPYDNLEHLLRSNPGLASYQIMHHFTETGKLMMPTPPGINKLV